MVHSCGAFKTKHIYSAASRPMLGPRDVCGVVVSIIEDASHPRTTPRLAIHNAYGIQAI